jgi:hypothetical protein
VKAVVYHADATYVGGKQWDYKKLFEGFRKNCAKFGIPVVHLTVKGHEGWGDENVFYDLDPKTVMLNREITFCDYLEKSEGVCWFSEPDYRIFKMWPPLDADAALLYRDGDGVPISPAWRMATNKALPLFQEFVTLTKESEPEKDQGWHCDSRAMAKVWEKLGKPNGWQASFLGVKIEIRKFRDYIKPHPIYGRNYAWNMKKELLLAEGV